MTIKEARIKAGLTQQGMSKKFGIPKRTIENWEAGTRKCPNYVKKLILEKLEGIIMKNGREIIKKAKEIDQFSQYIPELEIGKEVTLNDVWDGEGSAPEESYSYLLANNGDDISINYEFEIVQKKEDLLDTIIKITNIELI